MKTFEIYWDDLSEEKQEELRSEGFWHENIDMSPIAIIELEDADITPEDYDGPTTEVTLFYRDGANYKYTEKFVIPTGVLDRAKRVQGFYDQEEAQIQYDYDLGIDRETFHRVMGTHYNPDYDHNYVIVTEIEGVFTAKTE